MKKCVACKLEIDNDATKCIHCDTYQTLRRFLPMSNTLLALLIALISVVTQSTPVILNLFSSDETDIRIALARQQVDVRYISGSIDDYLDDNLYTEYIYSGNLHSIKSTEEWKACETSGDYADFRSEKLKIDQIDCFNGLLILLATEPYREALFQHLKDQLEIKANIEADLVLTNPGRKPGVALADSIRVKVYFQGNHFIQSNADIGLSREPIPSSYFNLFSMKSQPDNRITFSASYSGESKKFAFPASLHFCDMIFFYILSGASRVNTHAKSSFNALEECMSYGEMKTQWDPTDVKVEMGYVDFRGDTKLISTQEKITTMTSGASRATKE